MRTEASVLHLDLDAFFAAVEQRDKPSLRGKPVVVGGVGPRGVVATASYEARVFGVRSAMPTAEARRRCPHAAFLAGRFAAYRAASGTVMGLLRELSPLVEPLSLDEAYVDLAAARPRTERSPAELGRLAEELRGAVSTQTGGLTASVGLATSKLLAKVASELAKPDGWRLVVPGEERGLLGPLSVGVIPGVGPVTGEKLRRLGVATVADLRAAPADALRQVLGAGPAAELSRLAQAEDGRPVVAEREAKSISVEDTFGVDLVDPARLAEVVARHASAVAERLAVARLFARTVTLKVRSHDFTTHTRARTLTGATDSAAVLAEVARSLLAGVDTTAGVRLLGVGAAGLTPVLQEELFGPGLDGDEPRDGEAEAVGSESPAEPVAVVPTPRWLPGADVRHDRHGAGWVWGSGAGRVTVRFETRNTPPGPVRTFATDDPALHPEDA